MKRLSVFYTLICTLSPILRVYSLTGNTFTVLDTLIFVFYIVSVPVLLKRKFTFVKSYGIIFFYVLMHSSFIYAKGGDTGLFMRAMHQLNYVFFLVIYYKLFFDIRVADKSIGVAGVAATLFLVLQHTAHIFLGVTIPGQISAIAVREADSDNMVVGSNVVRFASFFAEPSAYAVFVVLPLAIELFYREKANYLFVILYCIGCVLSTSNTALACLAFLLIFYFVKNKIFNWKSIALIASGVAIIFIVSPFIEAIRTRVEGGTSFNNRFIGYEMMSKYFTNPLFGIGFISMEDVGEYMPGYARLVVYLGIIGALLYSIVYIYIFRTTSRWIILILFLFLNIGSNIFFAASIIFYSCFFLIDKSKKKLNEKSVNSLHNI